MEKCNNQTLKCLIFWGLYFQILMCYGQWQKVCDAISASPGNFYCVEASRNGTLFVGSDGGVFRSIDSGYTWVKVFDSGATTAIHCFNSDSCYGVGTYSEFGAQGVCIKTKNNGETWEIPLSYPAYWDVNWGVYAATASNVFIVSGLGFIQYTDSGFDTVLVNTPSDYIESLGAISCIDSDDCICAAGDYFDAAGPDYLVLRTQDGGASWQEIGSIVHARKIIHSGDSVVYIMGRFELMKSFDNGQTWVDIKSSEPSARFVSMAFPDKTHGYLIEELSDNDSVLVHYTSDGGLTWTISNLATPIKNGLDIDCLNTESCFLLTELREVYTLLSNPVPTNETSFEAHIKIHENLVHNVLNFTIKEGGEVSILNYSGKILMQNHASAGANEIDVKFLAPGLYFLVYSGSFGLYGLKFMIL